MLIHLDIQGCKGLLHLVFGTDFSTFACEKKYKEHQEYYKSRLGQGPFTCSLCTQAVKRRDMDVTMEV